MVQVYFAPDEPDQPIRLVGWQAVRAAPGQSVPVRVRTDPRLWRRWDPDRDRWSHLTGSGQLLVARGLGDVRATLKVEPGVGSR
jgi:beta-glucosidase